ncbi:MAG: hypothetical protein NXI20_20855 [bacterium]|nr:hypothetical protein [bacterium]
MKRATYFWRILPLLSLIVLWSCDGGKKANQESTKEEVVDVPPIKLTKAPESPSFEEAALTLVEPYQDRADTGAVNFQFNVSNYELGAQTSDAAERGIANSGKGQHVHLIINNGPYSAHYDDKFDKTLEAGNYTILAFLSRSYHESVKGPATFITKQLTVGDVTAEAFDFNAQHLFYSRPKGTYKGADTNKVMLDFFLLNTELSADGNKVRATINDQEFMIDEWAPYYIENAPKGDLQIKLELLNKDGEVIPGPYNVSERTVKLEE